MSLSRSLTFFSTSAMLLVACQGTEPAVVLPQTPSMTLATTPGGPSSQPGATAPGEVTVNVPSAGQVPETTSTVSVPVPAASTPVVVDVPILPVAPSVSPFPDLPHVGDLKSVCDLFARGPEKLVQAALPDSEETPGTVSDDGQRYDLRFGDAGNGFEGRVVFENTRTAVYGFYLSAEVELAVLLDGMSLGLQSSKQNPAGCNQVAVYHFVEILPGQVTLNFGPSSVERLSLVIERAQEATREP